MPDRESPTFPTPPPPGGSEQRSPALAADRMDLSPASVAGNVARGALIGVAETIPGVSGGTVALITGIYGRVIASAKAATLLPVRLLRRSDSTDGPRVDWWLVIPVAIGMLAAVFTIAGTMESFVSDQPVYSKALFMGMIAMSVAIPFQEIPRGTLSDASTKRSAAAVFITMAVLVFALTSLPQSEVTDPPLIGVFFAAAVAVCALVLPGVSGSFFLLVIGLYAPTLAAVDGRDLTYLAVFALGAIVGLASFVQLLEWLLENHHTLAMAGAAGLLLGSLRALWPWQDPDSGAALAVGGDWPAALGLFVLGVAIVAAVALIQRRLSRNAPLTPAGAA